MTVGPTSKTDESSTDRDRALAELAVDQAQPRPGSSTHGLPPGIPADSIPGYEILREIHRGGQGVVYQAIQKATRRKVAIKVVREGPFAGVSERARFDREVQILGHLNHPNIVAIHDSGAVAGSFYFVMDYISGHSLDAWAKSNTPTIEQVLKMFTTVCEAVSAAHLRGVIHRDLKPSNIRIDAGGQPHILDFGLAKVAGEAGSASRLEMMTMTGQFIGSLPWASPEQAEGTPERIDIRTDVYSLGVILYQMLTGRFPYDVVGNMRDVLENILKAEPARPSTVRRQINNEVETIVLKCLSKERERRYQSAGELARDIHRYLQGEPIEAKRDSGWYVISKTLRRYKPHVAVAAAFVMLLVGGGLIMSYLYVEMKHARDDAVRDKARAVEAQNRESDAKIRAQDQANIAEDLRRGLYGLAFKIFDTDDELLKKFGTTEIRSKLAQAAKTYVEEAAQTGADERTANTLAWSYEVIGDTQAAPNAPKTGEIELGMANYEKAVQIRDGLAQSSPKDPETLAGAARAHKKLGAALIISRERERARHELDTALDLYGRAIAGAPVRDKPRFGQGEADAMTKWAELLFSEASDAETVDEADRLCAEATVWLKMAQRYWGDRLARDPNDMDAARALPATLTRLTRNVVAPGQAQLKQAQFVEPVDAAKIEPLLTPVIPKFTTALAMNQQVVDSFEALVTKDADDRRFVRDLWIAYNDRLRYVFELAEACELQAAASLQPGGDARALCEAAMPQADRAVRLSQRLANDKSDAQGARDYYNALNKRGNILRVLGRFDDAERDFLESRRLRLARRANSETVQAVTDVAVAEFKLGQLARVRAEAEKDVGKAAAMRQTALDYLDQAMRAYEAAKGKGEDVEEEVGFVRLEIRKCEGAAKRAAGG